MLKLRGRNRKMKISESSLDNKKYQIPEIQIKAVIRERYARSVQTGGCCCSPNAADSIDCCGLESNNKSSIEDEIIGNADLGLSCGLPVQDAGIKAGDKVLDLGSGAGVDVFRAAKVVGKNGFVTGVDMTPEMIDQARINAELGGFLNTEFKLGEIENLPIPDNSQDVVISNCVINLVPNKELAFQEIYRTLKPGGHFCISDIVINGEIPEKIRQNLDAWAACISGALQKQSYLKTIENAGFLNIVVVRCSTFNIEPGVVGLESITVVGTKI